MTRFDWAMVGFFSTSGVFRLLEGELILAFSWWGVMAWIVYTIKRGT